MQNRSKGALAMVLAGAVTFSVTNSFLPEPMTRIANELALHVSGDARKTEIITKQEIAVREQSAIMNGGEGQTKLSEGNPAVQNTKQNDVSRKADHANIKSTATNQAGTNKTTISPKPSADPIESSSINEKNASEAQQPASKTSGAASPKAPAATNETKPTSTKNTSEAKRPAEAAQPAKPAASTKGTASTNSSSVKKTTSETTTPINHGQEVSQSAKEKASGNREQKENSRK